MPTLIADKKPAAIEVTSPRKTNKSLILTLGALGVIPSILVSYLSSAFVDNVLVKKYFDRAVPIILCFLILNLLSFALNYFYWRVQKLHEGINKDYYKIRIKAFSALLNAVFIFLLDYGIMASCAVLLAVVWGLFTLRTRVIGKSISYEATSSVRTILCVSVLCIGGLFIMRGNISIGEFYAVNAFSKALFSNAISLMPNKPKKKKEKSDSAAPSEPEHPAENETFSPVTAVREILKHKSVIVFTAILALIGTFSQDIYVTLQRTNMGDCIPAGDWHNLLINCAFMCVFTVCGFFARKGNQKGFRQIFHNKIPKLFEDNLDNFANLAMTAVLGVYFFFQIGQYNKLLASQATIGCFIAGALFLVLSLSESRRRMWGSDLGPLSDMLSSLFNSCIVVYLYCVLALQTTAISVGDLFVFLTVFDGLFHGVRSLNQMFLIYLRVRKKNAVQTTT